MACTLTRDDVSDIVLGVLREIHNNPSITEFSRFGIELVVSPTARATLYPGPITERIHERGCFLTSFGPLDCQKAQDVEDIVTAAWNDVKSSQHAVALAAVALPAQPTPPIVVQPAATVIVPTTQPAGRKRAKPKAKKGSARKAKAKPRK